MEIISKDRIPFAVSALPASDDMKPDASFIVIQVKGGGHTGNKGFSSSTGVQIAMSRFNKVIYHSDSNTADIGAGAIWDQVYAGTIYHIKFKFIPTYPNQSSLSLE